MFVVKTRVEWVPAFECIRSFVYRRWHGSKLIWDVSSVKRCFSLSRQPAFLLRKLVPRKGEQLHKCGSASNSEALAAVQQASNTFHHVSDKRVWNGADYLKSNVRLNYLHSVAAHCPPAVASTPLQPRNACCKQLYRLRNVGGLFCIWTEHILDLGLVTIKK